MGYRYIVHQNRTGIHLHFNHQRFVRQQHCFAQNIKRTINQISVRYDSVSYTHLDVYKRQVLKAGLPIYHVYRTIRETGTFFNDQAHIVYVNSQIKERVGITRLANKDCNRMSGGELQMVLIARAPVSYTHLP